MSRYEPYERPYRVSVRCQCGYGFSGWEEDVPDVCPQCGRILRPEKTSSLDFSWGQLFFGAIFVIIFLGILNTVLGDPIGLWWSRNWFFIATFATLFLIIIVAYLLRKKR